MLERGLHTELRVHLIRPGSGAVYNHAGRHSCGAIAGELILQHHGPSTRLLMQRSRHWRAVVQRDRVVRLSFQYPAQGKPAIGSIDHRFFIQIRVGKYPALQKARSWAFFAWLWAGAVASSHDPVRMPRAAHQGVATMTAVRDEITKLVGPEPSCF